MIRLLVATAVFIFSAPKLFAETPGYAVSLIPASLLKDASLVKRFEKVEFSVSGISKATKKVHRVVTIMNESAKSKLTFAQYTDRFVSFESASIVLYDKEGRELVKYGKKDMKSESSSDGLVEDGKIYYIQLAATSYPVTLEVKYEIRFKGTLFYPDFEVQGPDESVEYCEFITTIPQSIGLKHKASHVIADPDVSVEKDITTYRWLFEKKEAIKDEAGASHYRNRFPFIQVAPMKFELAGYEGDLSSWKSFGYWINDLYKGRDEFNEEKKAFFSRLVEGETTDAAKAKVLYSYLQQNFRYVSIQLGIGGFQPFPADFTDKKKYGDCKALSNYLKAALKVVGIRSHLALINAAYNAEAVDPMFPSNRFNHVVLCIPQEKDTIWLECTSRTAAFNVLGTFTENRNALLITDEGGVLVATPGSKAMHNRFHSATRVILKADGSGETQTQVSVNGEYKDVVEQLLDNEDSRKMEFLVNAWEFRMPDSYEFSNPGTGGSGFHLKTNITKVPDFSTGSKMFLSPRLYAITESSLPENKERRLDYYFQFPFIKSDTTVYVLPAGYEAEILPNSRTLVTDFGSFHTTCSFNREKSEIVVTARFEMFTHRIRPAQYNACREFVSEVIREYTEKIVVKKS